MYSAAAGMMAQQQRMDLVADDLANVSTTGYKPGRIAFRDLVYADGPRGSEPGVRIGAGSASTLVGRSMQQGSLETTNQPLDVALEGQGFLQVRTLDGRVGLTRDGQLGTDAQGRLTLHSGELLEPAITLPPGTPVDQVAIAADGRVTVQGRQLGQLRIVEVNAPGGLEAGPNNTFVPGPRSGQPRPAQSTTVRQGALESSGVDMASAMTDMMEAQRGFELASKAIMTQDQLLEIANQVKR
ncbi:flagellar hook-basal body protein [Conexibacter sp. SYSU D00693]|uniref:flagellar hook-basal body protein n=1 Tax=Conexibacter sp. SYSU D00693 TaxID=2812560 RepID=UPI00196AF3E8|nr:flagellar hook-basal body protein [Conexibacter sp. SYSU D00693]